MTTPGIDISLACFPRTTITATENALLYRIFTNTDPSTRHTLLAPASGCVQDVLEFPPSGRTVLTARLDGVGVPLSQSRLVINPVYTKLRVLLRHQTCSLQSPVPLHHDTCFNIGHTAPCEITLHAWHLPPRVPPFFPKCSTHTLQSTSASRSTNSLRAFVYPRSPHLHRSWIGDICHLIRHSDPFICQACSSSSDVALFIPQSFASSHVFLDVPIVSQRIHCAGKLCEALRSQ